MKRFFLKYGYLIILIIIILFFMHFKIVIGRGKSMLPTFKEFQVNLCMYQNEYKVDDIVYYRLDGFPISHRIINIDKVQMADGSTVDLYIMKGDNNPMPDYFPIFKENIVCRIIY